MKITAHLVCLVHEQIISLTGGMNGVRDFALLESAVSQIDQTFDNQELYPTIEDKAAILCFGLIQNHAFIDGNKRIGVNMMHSFLMMNGKMIDFSDKELVKLGLEVAQGKMNKDDIKNWIIKHEKRAD